MSQVIHKKFSVKSTVLNIIEEKKPPINDKGIQMQALNENFNIFASNQDDFSPKEGIIHV